MKHARALIGLALLIVLPPGLAGERAEPEVVGKIGGDPVYQVLPPNAIPAINAPSFLTGAAADAQMRSEEPVMGVVIEGRARAYSLWQLDANEIVNDRLGGIAFAPTW